MSGVDSGSEITMLILSLANKAMKSFQRIDTEKAILDVKLSHFDAEFSPARR